jgi:hypothetical protein
MNGTNTFEERFTDLPIAVYREVYWFKTMSNDNDGRTCLKTPGLGRSPWRRELMWLTVLVCLGASNAAAQAIVEYGGAVANVGGSVAATQKPVSAHLPSASAEDIIGVNRRTLEAQAGKDAAKLMLSSVPKNAWVRIDGKAVGKTPLLLQVAPGIHKVEMEGGQRQSGQRQVKLLPKETREIQLTLESRYPTHVVVSWPRH